MPTSTVRMRLLALVLTAGLIGVLPESASASTIIRKRSCTTDDGGKAVVKMYVDANKNKTLAASVKMEGGAVSKATSQEAVMQVTGKDAYPSSFYYVEDHYRNDGKPWVMRETRNWPVGWRKHWSGNWYHYDYYWEISWSAGTCTTDWFFG